MNKILVDTCCWINFLNKPNSQEKHIVDLLLDSDQICIAGIVLSELLQGTRTEAEANLLISKFAVLTFIEANFTAWKEAGLISASLRRKGKAIPLSDILLAATAMQNHCQIYTIDPHFYSIPNLKLYKL